MKPLGGKAYGSIPHLPTSRLGPGDHKIEEGQDRICCEKARDRHDEILVQEKLDGSCVAAANVDGQILALGRAGYLATTSKYEQHHLWAAWVRLHEARLRAALRPGQRLVGEWLAQAHGTRYELPHEPFVAFDLMTGTTRAPYDTFLVAAGAGDFVIPRLIHRGGPFPLADAIAAVETSGHGALDPVEGVVYRVQRGGAMDFLAKWVRPDKADGCYLPEVSGQPEIWHWRPTATVAA